MAVFRSPRSAPWDCGKNFDFPVKYGSPWPTDRSFPVIFTRYGHSVALAGLRVRDVFPEVSFIATVARKYGKNFNFRVKSGHFRTPLLIPSHWSGCVRKAHSPIGLVAPTVSREDMIEHCVPGLERGKCQQTRPTKTERYRLRSGSSAAVPSGEQRTGPVPRAGYAPRYASMTSSRLRASSTSPSVSRRPPSRTMMWSDISRTISMLCEMNMMVRPSSAHPLQYVLDPLQHLGEETRERFVEQVGPERPGPGRGLSPATCAGRRRGPGRGSPASPTYPRSPGLPSPSPGDATWSVRPLPGRRCGWSGRPLCCPTPKSGRRAGLPGRSW